MLRSCNFYFIIFVSLISIEGFSQQTRQSLEKEKAENIKKIKEGEKILNETEIVKKATIGKLNVVKRQINSRVKFISNLKDELSIYSDEINDLNSLIESLVRDLRELKIEYGEMIYNSYKSNSSLKKLTFIFSSVTYNQFFRRVQYLSQYFEMRKNQVEQISNVSIQLEKQKLNLLAKKNNKTDVLNEEIKESIGLENLKQKQRKIISELNQKQKKLRKEIESRRKALKELDNLISEVIKKANAKRDTDVNISIEDKELTEAFEKNIGKLEWPVLSGFISNKFGEHAHPILNNIKVKNDGVDIQTKKDSRVISVFSGQISTVAFIPGMNNVIIIKHGNYFTLYARIKNLKVEKGDIVKLGDYLADVVTNNEGTTELHFQIWKNNIKLNPEKWIYRK